MPKHSEEGLNLRIKCPRRHVSAAHRSERAPATVPNQIWSMDFVSDALFDERRLRALTLLDVFTREKLAIKVDKGITGEQMATNLDAVLTTRPAPQRIRVDRLLVKTDFAGGSLQLIEIVRLKIRLRRLGFIRRQDQKVYASVWRREHSGWASISTRPGRWSQPCGRLPDAEPIHD